MSQDLQRTLASWHRKFKQCNIVDRLSVHKKQNLLLTAMSSLSNMEKDMKR